MRHIRERYRQITKGIEKEVGKARGEAKLEDNKGKRAVKEPYMMGGG